MLRNFFLSFLVSLIFPGIANSVFAQSQSEGETLQIDLTEFQTPISHYVYGQFIEHLGRCIYGGLWAEMLEDRKFYYPITGETPAWTLFQPGNSSWQGEGHPYELLTGSPWLLLGRSDTLVMDSEAPFVGEHSPRISGQGPEKDQRVGIYQERLHLETGKSYTGRIVFRTESPGQSVNISLVWGSGASDRSSLEFQNPDSDYHRHYFRFTAQRNHRNGRLEIINNTEGNLWIGTVSLMPSDNVYGWRADTLELLKELNSPVYRWPGGNFVSGYDWKDGIGDPDKRPPRKNPAWTGIEHNDVGLHEYLKLCELIETEPFIAVNTGLGDIDMAADQVEYVNGASGTPMGQLRTENGRRIPWKVKFWAVGNEMYGDWQLGHMPLDQYVQKHIQIVDAMRFKDPKIQLIGVGAVGEWSRTMLEQCSNHMELISEHLYWQDQDSLIKHVQQISEGIRRVANAHRQYRQELSNLQTRDIPIALDEWNYWYGPNEFGELGVRYFLQDALGIAAGLHEMFRNSDLFYMANYAQTVNVIGAIKTTPTQAEFETTGLVLKLYRHQFGTKPVRVTPSASAKNCDISAALTEDGSVLTIGVVNPNQEALHFDLDLIGAELTGSGRKFEISGDNRFSHNDPETDRKVDIVQQGLSNTSGGLKVVPISVTLFHLDLIP